MRLVPVIALLASALAPPTALADATPVVDTSSSPHAVVHSVGINEVHWTEGFWAEKVRVNREQSIRSMWRLMRDSEYKPFYEHFLIAAGKADGDYHGATWNDGDFYKWIEAACCALASSPDDELCSAVNQAVAAVVAAQREDGYLHTPVLIARRNGDLTAEPFANRHDFEVYNLGHLMTAGCLHFRVTGERTLLTAAERAAQFLERAFSHPSPKMARQAVCPSHYMGLIELYRTTGNHRYLRLAQHVIELRNVAAGVDGGGGDDNQDRIPLTEQREAVGHAVRANYLFAGAADLYLETADPALEEPLEAVWRNVIRKKLYVTGACGALFDGASPDGSPRQGQITRIHQAYGRNYQLPNITAHNETCAAIGAVLWNWRRFLATGEARHIDWIELTLYNAVLSGVSLEGTDYFYVNPLKVVSDPPTDLRWSRERKPFIVSFCCPPNVVRTLAQVSGYAYSKSSDSLWVNLYGTSELETLIEGQPLRVTQQTEYPWDGQVNLQFEEAPSREFSLRLRKPGWADDVRISVNGEPVDGKEANGYIVVTRHWASGDKVDAFIPMPVVTLESHPLVEETRNQLAVKRGPIVYCLESTDLPAGVGIDKVGLPSDTSFVAKRSPELLGGVTTIEAQFTAEDSPTWDSLYRASNKSEPRQISAKLVPYYAWGNRGKSEMTVWLPRR